MRVLVVGAGSVGTRHIGNLLSLGVDVAVYRYRHHLAQELAEKLDVQVYGSLDDALDSRPEAVVVSNRTHEHMEVALKAAGRGLPLFIEKPVSDTMDGVEELGALVQAHSLVVEVGCMMRFHPCLQRVKELLCEGRLGPAYVAHAYAGEYLPDWRPSQDYRQSYSASSAQGGGALLDLVHELDYLIWWFGRVREVSAFLGHVSELEIEAEDVAEVLLRFESGLLGHVHMDYVRPTYRRSCEILGRDGTLSWDDASRTVVLERRGEARVVDFTAAAGFDRNQMFLDHMTYFLGRIEEGGGTPAVSLEDSVHVLRVALAAKRSSAEAQVAAV